MQKESLSTLLHVIQAAFGLPNSNDCNEPKRRMLHRAAERLFPAAAHNSERITSVNG
jgi:hypothetical protein